MSEGAQQIPLYSSNLFSPEWVADPYPTFEEIRALGPVVYDCSQDVYVVTGYTDCARILGNVREFDQNNDLFITAYGGVVMEAADNPLHNQMRAMVQDDFRPDVLQERREFLGRVVASQIGPALERLGAGEEVEAVSALCRNLPIHTIAELLGWRLEDIPLILELSSDLDKVFKAWHDGSPRGERLRIAGIAASRRLNDYVRGVIADRRARPRGDLVSRMLGHPHAELISEQDLVAQICQLVFAGHETTSKLSGLILLALGQNPEQLRLLREDRTLLRRAIEEVHRWTPPVLHNYRYARETCVVADRSVPKGASLMVVQAAANRDPNRWEQPSRLDITRDPQGHLGFGFGMHTCLGMHLARLELEIWLDALIKALGEWEIASPVEWGPAGIVRGPQRFTIRTAS